MREVVRVRVCVSVMAAVCASLLHEEVVVHAFAPSHTASAPKKHVLLWCHRRRKKVVHV